ncbi:MAG: thioredoxin-dependent thiol peroxidase [Thermoprotei archaeon]
MGDGEPGEGDLAPDFELEDQNGVHVRLSGLKGRKVVLYFYPKDDTPGCTKEACDFRDNLDKIEAEGAVVLGVSADTLESHKKFAQKYNLNFHLLSDRERKVITQYGVYKKKKMYGREHYGVERSTFIIDEQGRIIYAQRGVKVDGHIQQVLEHLQ